MLYLYSLCTFAFFGGVLWLVSKHQLKLERNLALILWLSGFVSVTLFFWAFRGRSAPLWLVLVGAVVLGGLLFVRVYLANRNYCYSPVKASVITLFRSNAVSVTIFVMLHPKGTRRSICLLWGERPFAALRVTKPHIRHSSLATCH